MAGRLNFHNCMYGSTMIACVLIAALALTEAISVAETISYHYAPGGMLDRAQYDYGKVIHYTYDNRGNRTLMGIKSFAVSGAAFNYPEPGFRAALAMDIRASSLQTGWLTYYFTGQKISLISNEIDGFTVLGSTVRIEGHGSVNGVSGYSFIVTVYDGEPGSSEVVINNPDGIRYFESGLLVGSGGNIVLADPASQYLVTTFIDPAGSGAVTPDCASGCSYESGTSVTLSADASPGFSFTSWGGCDWASGAVCVVNVNSDKSLTANFSICPLPVRLQQTTASFWGLQDAYDAAVDGDVIQSQAQEFSEDLILNMDKSVTFIGGYDCAYSGVMGKTGLSGDVHILNGNVTMENFIVQ